MMCSGPPALLTGRRGRAGEARVTIGQALAEARHRAGLTVAEVSERTRIREKIIRAIENDDYSTCGGDFYARGNIRAVAKVVGTDSGPLIQEYDARHRAPGALSAISLEELLAASEQAPPAPRPDPPTAPGRVAADPAPAHGLAAAVDLAAVAYTTVRLWLSRSAAGRAAGSVTSEARRYLTWVVVLGVSLIVAVGFGGYFLLASPQRTAVTPSAASEHTAVGGDAARSRPNPAVAAPSPAAAVPAPAAPAAQRLIPVSIAAFGPGGGDNPQLALLAIGGQPSGGWRTDWYNTARFGNLYPGTGLLLDMGHPVTLTAAQVALGHVRGASLQIRVGAAPALAGLRPVARAADAGGVVRFRLATPARGRYVLIWFTKLPADPSGTFQEQVWNIRLDGRT
jgi:Helix-turn-helix domain